MNRKLLFFLLIFFGIQSQAQEYIFGKILSEENSELPDVTVINLRTDEHTFTNAEGHFMISGKAGDRLRLIKLGYERADLTVSNENIKASIQINLIRNAQLIDEVEIIRQLTGNLKTDSEIMNPPKKLVKLEQGLKEYFKRKSSPELMAAKPGEFVQPLGPGFPVGKVKDQWDDVDLNSYLRNTLGEEYFTDLKIPEPQIQHFIAFVLNDFERQKILKYAYVSDADLARFQGAVLKKIDLYKIN